MSKFCTNQSGRDVVVISSGISIFTKFILMLAVEQHFDVCIEEIISNKPYGAKSVRKSGEHYDIIMTLTTLLIPSATYISY